MTDFLDLLDATWPAAGWHRAGPWVVREGLNGGSRVSAATAEGEWDIRDIQLAEAEQDRLGQTRLFMIRAGEDRLDNALADLGYSVMDPVVVWRAPLTMLAAPPQPLSAFSLWPPLAVIHDIWADGGITSARVAVMQRATGPKTAILGRAGERAAGAAFAAAVGDQAMLHALHVLPAYRRQGSATNMLRAAAIWAQHEGAADLSLAVTRANTAANGLYASLGMAIVGRYHYRMKPARERHQSS
jgi:ribosomal protein S18 acetylase RimI-like enzyme